MKITVNDETMLVKWQHYNPEDLTIDSPGTDCIIKNLEGEQKFFAHVGLYYQDIFNKKSGRKASFTKAIKDLPRETRKEIWNELKVTNQFSIVSDGGYFGCE